MSNLTPPMVGQTATWLSIVSQLFTTRMASLLEPHGLTPAQFNLLNHITRPDLQGGTRISDIAAAVEVNQPAVTKAAAKFQNMGLIDLIEDKHDKRVRIVKPRPEAQMLIGQIRQSIGPDLFTAFSAIDDDEIEGFLRNLKKLGGWLSDNRRP
ncbi:MAG: MarR family winged helix-turn-helix transcriptional regulator [Sulfitobacter sp.]